ncbi:MAG: DUF4381 domain-containing protein [Gammaproteobacteria bacterium]|nr:DUF4381 domain-containing protein [Gammaproteobacteria bacterium]
MNPASEALQLRDIHLPDGISWWPPAPGWWLVLLLLIITIGLGIFFHRYRQTRKLHKAARQELEKIKHAYEQDSDPQVLIRSLSIWLRRVCLSIYPRTDVAGLTGKQWLELLDKCFIDKKQTERFSQGAGTQLIHGPYQTSVDFDPDNLLNICQHWLQCLPKQRPVKP